MKLIFRIGIFCLCAWATFVAQAHAESDPQAIARAMKKLFDKPQAPLKVALVSVEGDYAVAGWLQEKRGGRALLEKRQGQWVIAVCGGDGLTLAQTLAQTGMGTDTAQRLAQRVVSAESRLPAATLRQFASFEGVMKVDGDAAHGHGATVQNHHKH